jgi:hypothetical protein
MAEEHPNYTMLRNAGLIRDDHHENPDEYKKLESLTACEIACLESIREKLGGGEMTQGDTSSF